MRSRRHPIPLVLAVLLALGALAMPAGHVPAADAQEPVSTINVELILDSSGSMDGLIGGETRMQIAKRVLKRVVSAIPEREGVNVGFRIYGHRGDNTAAGRPESCRSSDLLVPIDGVDKAAIFAEVDAAQPTGWTPLAYSLGRAGRDMPPADPGVVNAVVLLTDGLETCGGDACAVAGALHASDVALVTHVVSFAVRREERRTLQCIADEGGGLLVGAQNADQLTGALFTILGDLDVVNLTGWLEIESVDGVWPDATAVCQGPLTDADPDGDPVTVRFDRTNLAEVPIGTCDVSWTEPSGDRSVVRATVASDRLTRIRGSLLSMPQGAGEDYRISAPWGTRIWEGPLERGDRYWVRPGRYRIELTQRVGDPTLAWADVVAVAGAIIQLHAATEP